MAGFDFDFPQELFAELQRLERNTDEIQQEMLMGASPIMVDALARGVRDINAIDTGEMINSIKARKPSKGKDGNWQVFIGPSGYSKDKTQNSKYKLPNAAKLIFIEYGTTHQTARPILQKVKNASEQKIINKMQEIYNKGV